MNIFEKKTNYQKFLKRSKAYFRYLLGRKKNTFELRNIYNFYISPGQFNGLVDNRICELFFGHRPIGSYSQFSNGNYTKAAIIERGAALQYFQLDNGNVMVSITPARTDNMGPIEDEIIIDYIKNVRLLNKIWFLRKHWLFFIAYMNQTSIAGKKTVFNWLILKYLRLFKHNVIEKKNIEPKAWTFTKKVITFMLTVGLSGWLIFFMPNKNAEKELQIQQDILDSVKITEVNSALLNQLKDIIKEQNEILKKMKNNNADYTSNFDEYKNELLNNTQEIEEVLKKMEKQK